MKKLFYWFRYQFKWQLKSMIAWSLILGALSLFVGWAFKTFSESGYFDLINNLPEYMKKLFLGNGVGNVAGSLEGYLSLEFFSWMGLMFAFYPFISGTAAIAGEIESKTIEPLMSKPLSRTVFYFGKFAVILINILIIVAVNYVFLWLGLKMSDTGLSTSVWLKLFSISALSAMSFVSLSLLISAIVDQSRTGMTVAVSFGVLQYVVNMISSAINKSGWAKWTIFYHSETTKILSGQSYPWGSVVFLSVVTVVLAVAGWAAFNRKNISI